MKKHILCFGDSNTHGYCADPGDCEDGGIRFVESPCPDHTCESFGVLTKQGDWAACLPARASVTVE